MSWCVYGVCLYILHDHFCVHNISFFVQMYIVFPKVVLVECRSIDESIVYLDKVKTMEFTFIVQQIVNVSHLSSDKAVISWQNAHNKNVI